MRHFLPRDRWLDWRTPDQQAPVTHTKGSYETGPSTEVTSEPRPTASPPAGGHKHKHNTRHKHNFGINIDIGSTHLLSCITVYRRTLWLLFLPLCVRLDFWFGEDDVDAVEAGLVVGQLEDVEPSPGELRAWSGHGHEGAVSASV